MPDFDFSTLITDRAPADLEALRDLLATPMADWTAEQLAAFNAAISKGAYNYTDLNRVTACMDYLNERLVGCGYETGYHPIIVHTETPPPTPTLPEGYTELEYIESTGSQYIDTGFHPTQATRIIMDVQMTTLNPTDHEWFFGARRSGSVDAFGFFWNYSAQKFGATYGNQQVDISSDVGKNERIIIDQNRNILSFNGVQYNFPETTFSSPVSLPLLARNTNGALACFTSAKLYSCKIYDDDVLVRDFVPCQTDIGTVGLYDTINAQFYGNSGTGTFLAAPIDGYVNLPVGYTQVQYIESTGSQYINTEHTVQSENMRVIIRFSYIGDHSGSSIFGSERNTRYSICPFGVPQLYVGQTAQIPMAYSPAVNEICLLEVHANNGAVSNLWNSSQSGSYPYSGQLNHSDPVYIFCNNIAGQPSQFTPMRLYAFTLYDNNNKISDYIPCINQNGDVGLYDLVSDDFLLNSGTGVFSQGPVVQPPDPPKDPYTWYEEDIPTTTQMQRYLGNMAALRGALELPTDTVGLPGNMTGLTQAEANAIEGVLWIIEGWIQNMAAAWFYSGDLYAGEV